MDPTQIPTYLALVMNAVVMLLMIASFFRRYATKDDIKKLNDKLDNLENGQSELKARMSALEARQGALETRFDGVDKRLDGIDDAIRHLSKKVDDSLELHREVSIELKVMQASILRLESYFETPKLKTS
ncbi:MAG: DUF2730 family protein [Chloroflexota bacterium]|nr:DUF2730 family protein [Chloroflexota bacterium]